MTTTRLRDWMLYAFGLSLLAGCGEPVTDPPMTESAATVAPIAASPVDVEAPANEGPFQATGMKIGEVSDSHANEPWATEGSDLRQFMADLDNIAVTVTGSTCR